MISFLARIKQAFAPLEDDDVTNKKYVDDLGAAKAGAEHGHSIEDVADLQAMLDGKVEGTVLQTALDGKADASHKHAASQITDLAAAIENSGVGGSFPTPTNTAGIGQWVGFTNTLPTGGTWAYYALRITPKTSEELILLGSFSPAAGVAAGGTSIGTNRLPVTGFAWRLA